MLKFEEKKGAVRHLMHLIDISLIIYSINLKLEKNVMFFLIDLFYI